MSIGQKHNTIKKNTEALAVTCKEIGLELKADKTTYIVMTGDHNAGRSCNKKLIIAPLKRKYLGTTITNQNSVQEEIKSRLKSGNACYYSVWNLLSSSLQYKNSKSKIYRSQILHVVYGCDKD
jgi:hypothetical protein